MPASTAAISSRESRRLMSIPETSPTNTGWIWRMDTFMCRLLSPCRLDYNDAVHFGIFVEEMRQGASQRAAFRDVFELSERADAWGMDCVWLGEIHFTPTRSVISASLPVATATPRPYQVPHPPLRMATTSDETFPAAGRMGLPIFVGLRVTEIPDLQAQLAPYRQAWREAGHPGQPSVYLRIPVYASTTEKGAVEEPRESLTAFFARQTELARAAVGRAGAGPADRRRFQAERMASLSYEDILARKVAFGTARGVIDRLAQLRDELGLDGIVAELNPGGRIPPELETRSLEILAREVVPAFR